MRRREFITLIAGVVAARPRMARSQHARMPVIGLLTSRGAGDSPELMTAVRQGLKDAGFIEGQNVAIEYRFGGNQIDRLPGLATDLVHRQVAVIVALTTQASLAAKQATTTIPVVFEIGGDPIHLGLVASLSRPGGNVTGVTQLNQGVAPKRLELLHELLPSARVIGRLVNPDNSPSAESQSNDVLPAAGTLGLELDVVNASTINDFEAAFAKLLQLRAGGLLIDSDPFFTAQQEQLAALALRHAVPAVYETREFVAAGGLMSYGGNLAEAYRLAGVYAARILKGEIPGELPVEQVTKVELFLNLKTAKTLGVNVPLPLSGRADEVIE